MKQFVLLGINHNDFGSDEIHPLYCGDMESCEQKKTLILEIISFLNDMISEIRKEPINKIYQLENNRNPHDYGVDGREEKITHLRRFIDQETKDHRDELKRINFDHLKIKQIKFVFSE